MEIKSLLEEFLEKKADNGVEKQTPQVYSIFCSDSRIHSVDFICNPHNKLFVMRNIGNQSIGFHGSASYPLSHLNSIKLAAVVGHVGCGAVGAAYKMSRSREKSFNAESFEVALESTISSLKNHSRRLIIEGHEEAIEHELLPMTELFSNALHLIGDDEEPFLPKYAEANVHLQVAGLMQIREVREKVESGKLTVVGTLFDLLGKHGPKGKSHLVNVNGRRDIESFEGIKLKKFF